MDDLRRRPSRAPGTHPPTQINADNFNDLEVAWRLKTHNFGPPPEYNFQSTPLMVDGVLYTTAGSRRAVVAADAGTGELLWMHRLDEGERGAAAPRRLSGRGLAYRDDGRSGQILYVTPGYQLIALDAATGQPIPSFGRDGIVDLKQDMDQDIDSVTGEVGLHAAPIVAGDPLLIGAAHLPGSAPRSMENIKGYVRGFDARTGERRWIFHTIPGADEFGNDTWLNESWRYTGNTGSWGQMSIDEELGVAYFATEMPTNDYYGGHRHGDNLFADSLVAVDLETGERLWYYQFIHHDVWDWDLPGAPILADITVEGRAIKAVAQPSKQGWLYVFDRETGEPVWPIDERPVEASNVPGEAAGPNPALPDKASGIRPAGCRARRPDRTSPRSFERRPSGSSRTIASVRSSRRQRSRCRRDRGATLILPSQAGGANWPGGSLDPETGIVYLYSYTQVVSLGLINDPERSDMNFIRGRASDVSAVEAALNIDGIPIIKPPWGLITAIDLNDGEVLWRVAHGETPDHIRNHARLQGVTVPRTGRVGRIGTLVTKTLVIAGEGGVFTTPSVEEGAMLRAYDKATGEECW